MNAIGDQFKAARESRGLTQEQVANETNIAKRFIAAMEAEDFSVFPGDPYIIGFLRNYADYLGLDSQALVQSFRGIRIQEQPVPFDALLKPRKTPLWPFIAALAVLGTALGAFLIFGRGTSAVADNGDSLAKKEPASYILEESAFEKRLYEGDSIAIAYRGDQYIVRIREIADRVAIETPVSVTRFMLGEEGSLDFDKDNHPELYVFVADFQKNQASKGALIRFKAAESLGLAAPASQAQDSAAAVETTVKPETAAAVAERPSTQQTVVFSGKRSPHPFVLNITFRNYSMFRHEIDRDERVEAYYHKGDQINVTATNRAKIWASNAASVKLTIQASGGQSADVELGSPGQVVVKALRWTQADDGTWNLALYDVN